MQQAEVDMRPPLYDAVHDLALGIVNASARDDETRRAELYAELKNLCLRSESGELNHPLQWEALGDFSDNAEDAHAAYAKGLECATRLNLGEYIASIKFAMAERHHDEGNTAEARKLALQARTDAKGTDDDQLKAAIKEFLAEIGKG
jgi:hypothetical protein